MKISCTLKIEVQYESCKKCRTPDTEYNSVTLRATFVFTVLLINTQIYVCIRSYVYVCQYKYPNILFVLLLLLYISEIDVSQVVFIPLLFRFYFFPLMVKEITVHNNIIHS